MEGHERRRDDKDGGRLTQPLRRRQGRPLRTRIAIAAILLEGAAALLWVAARAARFVRRSWEARVAVSGPSMAPTLQPGDWLLVDPDAYVRRSPRQGELALVADPRRPERLLVKRVAAVDPSGALEVSGDAPSSSSDSRAFGPVDADAVSGRPWFRYWPPGRAGWLR